MRGLLESTDCLRLIRPQEFARDRDRSKSRSRAPSGTTQSPPAETRRVARRSRHDDEEH